jgi:hypothetical protein
MAIRGFDLRKHHFLGLWILALVPVVWLAPALRPGRVLSSADMCLGSYLLNQAMPAHFHPSNELVGDTVMQMMPWRRVTSDEVRSGRIPFWNPHAFAGSPLLGNAQSGVFDPLSFPYLLTREPVRATAWVMLLRLWVAGFGTWLLATRLGASRWAAVGAGVIYQVGGFTLVWLMYPLVASSVWFPWAMLAAELFAVKGGAGRLAMTGLALSVVTFGGHVELAFFAAVTLAAWIILRRFQERGLSLRTLGGAAGAVATMAVLTALLTAPQTLPFLDALSQGMLVTGRLETWGVRVPRLEWFVLSLFPFLFGRPVAGEVNLAGSFTNFCEQSGAYVSVLGLVLVILGVLGSKRHRAWQAVALMGAVAWAFAAGLPPFPWLVRVLPVVNVAAPARVVFVALLAFALLAARGIDVVTEGARPKSRTLLGWGLAALASFGLAHGIWLRAGAPGYMKLLGLAGRITTVRAWFAGEAKLLVDSFPALAPTLARDYVLPWSIIAGMAAVALLLGPRLGRRFAPVAIGIILCDLALFGWGFNPAIPIGQAYPRTARIEEVCRVAGDGRILVLNWGLYANVASYYGLDDINGYDAIGRRRLTELLRVACPFPPGPIHWPIANFNCYDSVVLDILSVRAVASALPLDAENLSLVSHPPSSGYLYRNTRALPRAFVPDRVVRASNLGEAVGIARTSPPDPHREALIEAPPGAVLPIGPGRVTYRRAGANRIVLETAMDKEGLVVVSEAWDPGWRAGVDGVDVPVYPCDIAVMAVRVPAGTHRVDLVFRPRWWSLAVAMWLIGLVAVVGLLSAGRWRSSSGKRGTPQGSLGDTGPRDPAR